MTHARAVVLNRITAGAVLVLMIGACAPRPAAMPSAIPTETPPAATATATPTDSSLLTPNSTLVYPVLGTPLTPDPPQITATPLGFDDASPGLASAIEQLLDFGTCYKTDYLTQIAPAGSGGFLGYSVGKPRLIEVAPTPDFQHMWVDEIADSQHGRYRAYLVDEMADPSVCPNCVVRMWIYVVDRSNGRVHAIDWQLYQPNRPLFRLRWVGDHVLSFFQSLSPHYAELIAVDVKNGEFVYYSGFSCQ